METRQNWDKIKVWMFREMRPCTMYYEGLHNDIVGIYLLHYEGLRYDVIYIDLYIGLPELS